MREELPACPPISRASMHDFAEPLRCRVDRSSQARWTCSDDRHIVDDCRIELRRDAEAAGGFSVCRMLEYRSVGADHERQFVASIPSLSTRPRPSWSDAASRTT